MAVYHSLYDYLDDNIPGRLMIWIRNTFSFLPFVEPVNPLLIRLRKSLDDNDLDYVANYDFAAHLIEVMDFNYSIEEKNELHRLRQLMTIKEQLVSEPIPVKSERVEEPIVVQKEFIAPKTIFQACLDPDWKKELQPFIKDSQAEGQFILILDAAKNNPRKVDLLRAASYFFDEKKWNNSQIMSLFNGLKTDNDVQLIESFVNYRARKLSADFFKLANKIKSMSGEDQVEFNNTREFNGYRFRANELNGIRDVFDQEKAFMNMKNWFIKWAEPLVINNKPLKIITDKINILLDEILQLITICNDSKIIDLTIRKQQDARTQEYLINEKRDFLTQLANHEVQAVSMQRLQELFSSDGEYKMRLKQCRNAGVNVFDANDKKAVRAIINSRAAEADSSDSYSNSSIS